MSRILTQMGFLGFAGFVGWIVAMALDPGAWVQPRAEHKTPQVVWVSVAAGDARCRVLLDYLRHDLGARVRPPVILQTPRVLTRSASPAWHYVYLPGGEVTIAPGASLSIPEDLNQLYTQWAEIEAVLKQLTKYKTEKHPDVINARQALDAVLGQIAAARRDLQGSGSAPRQDEGFLFHLVYHPDLHGPQAADPPPMARITIPPATPKTEGGG